MEEQFEDLVKQVKSYNDKPEDIVLLRKAWEFARIAHADQKRESGDLFITHPLATAHSLAKWKMDITSIVAGILHDAIDWGGATYDDLVNEFGEEVAKLIQGVSRVSQAKIRGDENEFFVENLRKMILAMAQDLRVVIIRMAERLDNMRSLNVLPEERQKRYAKESLEIFGPLSERLGMGEVKGELEDLAFPYVYPQDYARVIELSRPYYKQAEEIIYKMKRSLHKHLAAEGVQAKIGARKKHKYSLWKKLKRPEIEWNFEKINDIVALRIRVEEVKECYIALGVLHSLYKPVAGVPMRDFIAHPKSNGYRSIHTNVLGPGGHVTEVQIRTFEMHEQAEHGVASHWAYGEAKSKGASDASLEKGEVQVDQDKLSWVKQLALWQEEISDSQEFLDAVKFEALNDRIYVFTPKGDVHDLPNGATPVDVAYAIHTGLGRYIRGAMVNGKIVPLNKKLKNGDVVEILKHKNPVNPNEDWLSFVATSTARREINKRLRNN